MLYMTHCAWNTMYLSWVNMCNTGADHLFWEQGFNLYERFMLAHLYRALDTVMMRFSSMHEVNDMGALPLCCFEGHVNLVVMWYYTDARVYEEFHS